MLPHTSGWLCECCSKCYTSFYEVANLSCPRVRGAFVSARPYAAADDVSDGDRHVCTGCDVANATLLERLCVTPPNAAGATTLRALRVGRHNIDLSMDVASGTVAASVQAPLGMWLTRCGVLV